MGKSIISVLKGIKLVDVVVVTLFVLVMMCLLKKMDVVEGLCVAIPESPENEEGCRMYYSSEINCKNDKKCNWQPPDPNMQLDLQKISAPNILPDSLPPTTVITPNMEPSEGYPREAFVPYNVEHGLYANTIRQAENTGGTPLCGGLIEGSSSRWTAQNMTTCSDDHKKCGSYYREGGPWEQNTSLSDLDEKYIFGRDPLQVCSGVGQGVAGRGPYKDCRTIGDPDTCLRSGCDVTDCPQ
jgi:hypothetical protein